MFTRRFAALLAALLLALGMTACGGEATTDDGGTTNGDAVEDGGGTGDTMDGTGTGEGDSMDGTGTEDGLGS